MFVVVARRGDVARRAAQHVGELTVVSSGRAVASQAAAPATIGAAKLVPLASVTPSTHAVLGVERGRRGDRDAARRARRRRPRRWRC